MVAGSIRRKIENIDLKSIDYFLDLCIKAQNKRDSCLVALLFLSGRRINEIMGLKKSNFDISNFFLVFNTFNLKAFRSEPNKEFTILREGRYYQKIFVSISKTTEAYKNLGAFIEEHLETLESDDFIFYRFRGKGHIGSVMAYKIVTFLDPNIWPHWFRHQRFTNVYNIIKGKVDEPIEALMVLHDFTKHRRIDTTMDYLHRLKIQEVRKEI